MASQRHPLAGALLATRCPRCRVMNYGSPFSALFCRAVKAIARGLVQRGWSSNTCTAERRGSDVTWTRLQSAAEHADEAGRRKHTYEGRFHCYVYACVNKHPAEYLIVVKVVCRCTVLSYPVLIPEHYYRGHTLTAGSSEGLGLICLSTPWREEERDPD